MAVLLFSVQISMSQGRQGTSDELAEVQQLQPSLDLVRPLKHLFTRSRSLDDYQLGHGPGLLSLVPHLETGGRGTRIRTSIKLGTWAGLSPAIRILCKLAHRPLPMTTLASLEDELVGSQLEMK